MAAHRKQSPQVSQSICQSIPFGARLGGEQHQLIVPRRKQLLVPAVVVAAAGVDVKGLVVVSSFIFVLPLRRNQKPRARRRSEKGRSSQLKAKLSRKPRAAVQRGGSCTMLVLFDDPANSQSLGNNVRQMCRWQLKPCQKRYSDACSGTSFLPRERSSLGTRAVMASASLA